MIPLAATSLLLYLVMDLPTGTFRPVDVRTVPGTYAGCSSGACRRSHSSASGLK
jgi:hypothetical protein